MVQIRSPDDPMKTQELECFQWALQCARDQFEIFDLTEGRRFSDVCLKRNDVVVIGGSGNYSVATAGPWWDAAADNMTLLHDLSIPCFASCWGFQAMARALGGVVVTDLARAEVGTVKVSMTPEARHDPIFGIAPPIIRVQSGHQDIVECLPEDAVCLASSDRVKHQAMMFPGKPIYGTQFHPELSRQALVERLEAYPQYIDSIAGTTVREFSAQCRETPDAVELLRRFIHVFCE